jgi:N-acetylmuramoyl-L-alanine amidase
MLAVILALALLAPHSDADRAYEEARASYFKLKASPEQQKMRDNWLRTIAAFTGVAESYPKSEQAARALYTAADLWNSLSRISRVGSDLDQALANYERVASEYPANTLADDALYATALIHRERRHDDAKAARAAKQIVDAHANGDMAGKARALLAQTTARGVKPAASDDTAPKLVGRRENAPQQNTITEVKRWSNKDYSRIAVTLTGAAQARSGWVNGARSGGAKALIVDIAPAHLPDALALPTADDALVTDVKAEARAGDTVRLTLQLAKTARQRIMVLENPYRVVIDVADDSPAASRPAVAKREGAKRRVVIDPGHGGKDVGACGPSGTYEKDIALAIAKLAAEQLEASGVEVQLTRNDDTFISLEERTAIANKTDADLFVSIHLNAAKKSAARGIETYYLDTTSNRYAIRLAARENRTSEDRVSDTELALADHETKAAVKEAKKLATLVQKNVFESVRSVDKGTRNHGVKSSLFYVLLGARMPAVLVETGFISNPAEEKLLKTATHQRNVARAITRAVLESLNVKIARPRPVAAN